VEREHQKQKAFPKSLDIMVTSVTDLEMNSASDGHAKRYVHNRAVVHQSKR
jgi:hypothetical protein